jgi:histone deacetylase 6
VIILVMQARSVSEEELLLLHTQEHINLMQETANMKLRELTKKQDDFRSVYLHPGSYQAACLAAGSVLQVRM